MDSLDDLIRIAREVAQDLGDAGTPTLVGGLAVSYQASTRPGGRDWDADALCAIPRATQDIDFAVIGWKAVRRRLLATGKYATDPDGSKLRRFHLGECAIDLLPTELHGAPLAILRREEVVPGLHVRPPSVCS